MNKRFRILVVDDDYINLQAITHSLEYEFDIFTALDGYEAINTLKEHKPDLILLDVMMPDFNGFDVCKVIKSDPEFSEIPVIFLSALDTLDGELRGLELGGIDYITKPINFSLLKQRLSNHIQLKERNDLVKEQRDLLSHQKEELAHLLAEQRLQNKLMRETKAALRENRQQLSDIIDFLPDATLAIDNEKRVIIWNRAIEKMTGVPASEMIGKGEYAYTVPFYGVAQPQLMDLMYADHQEIAARYPSVTRSGDTLMAEVFCPALHDGTGAWVFVKASPLHDPSGNIVGVIESIRDISARKLAETYREMNNEVLQILNKPGELDESLRYVISAIKYRVGFDAVGIRLQAGDDFPYLVHEGFPKDFILKENELIGRAADGGVCLDSNGRVSLECTCGLILSGKADPSNPLFTPGGSFWTNDSVPLLDLPPELDPRFLPRNECIHQGYASFALIPIRSNNGIIGVLHVTDRRSGRFTRTAVESLEGIAAHIGSALMRKKSDEEKSLLEQQFHHAQKMESLGVLAGGIAHDFNNILAIIIGYCALIKMDYDEAEIHIPEIEKAAQRAAELCRLMLAYAGKAQLTQDHVNMWQLVDEIVMMLKSTISKNVAVKARLATGLPPVNGDAGQLRQVVMNLIINAAEAVGEKQGEIRVSLAKTVLNPGHSEKDHLGKSILPGWYLCLAVSDTGCGMNEETRRKIFEPFFTTKFSGRGLGMSAVLGIITAHHGALQLVSQPDQGTTFTVYLPVQISETIGVENNQQVLGEPWQGYGTVLLVDDEVHLMIIAIKMLEKLGFSVIGASNGREALELYLKNAAEITLVITDLSMPEMDGYALFRELKNLNPELPIVISSGFGDAGVTSRIPREDIAGLISKPFTPLQLLDVLKGVLDAAS